jgi:diphthine-ammonia ligase
MSSNTSSGLNVIALISGGKDSLYSILHCIKNGHRVVALANLHPPLRSPPPPPPLGLKYEGEDDEWQNEDMDSFMYQTVGHNVIPLYETALGIPLYRAPITGGAVDTSGVYRNDAEDQMADSGPGQNGDETESLVPLLMHIKRVHPCANAISAGAILSTYQRTRIENVAARLGLVPLAWLWMYPHLPPPEERRISDLIPSDTGLLDDMASVGCDSRIIKVASGGLDDDFLWGNVASQDGQLRKRITNAMRRFAGEDLRGAVLGEGGEYETLALDGPDFLWKQKIVIEEGDRQIRKADGGVSYVTITGAKCVSKEATGSSIGANSVRRPSRLDERFESALDELRSRWSNCEKDTVADLTDITHHSQADITINQPNDGTLWTVSNLTAPEAGPGAGKQMNGICRKLEQILESYTDVGHSKRSPEDIVFATVLLRSMKDFASINGVYISLFKKPNPPARVTVACGDSLPAGVEAMASFVVDLGARDMRQGLHVQSRSYWAPANIGPYSQAITVPYHRDLPIATGGGLVFIAGQIPLEPASMEVADGMSTDEDTWFENFSLHATLSLQHLWRIGMAMRVDWWLGAVVFLATDQQRIQSKARVAWQLWEQMNRQCVNDNADEDEEPALDAWDIKYGRHEDRRHASTRGHSLPNFDIVRGTPQIPPFFAVEVDELPRGSDIEWQGLGSRCDRVKIAAKYTISPSDKAWSTVIDDHTTFYSIEIGKEQFGPSLETHIQQVMGSLGCTVETALSTIYTAYPLSKRVWKGRIVPCKAVWGSEGRRLAAGITVRMMSAGFSRR